MIEERETAREEIVDALARAVAKLEALRQLDPDPYVRVQPSAEETRARDVLDAVYAEMACR